MNGTKHVSCVRKILILRDRTFHGTSGADASQSDDQRISAAGKRRSFV